MTPLLILKFEYRKIDVIILTDMQKAKAAFTHDRTTYYSGEFVTFDNAIGWALFKINDLLQKRKGQ